MVAKITKRLKRGSNKVTRKRRMNRRKFTKIRHRGGQRGGFLNKLRTTYKKIRGKDTSNNKWYESQIKALKEKRAKKKELYKEVKKTYKASKKCSKGLNQVH